MPEFILDTSGSVNVLRVPGVWQGEVSRWADLDAFTQGYIEALFFTECDDKARGLTSDEWNPETDNGLPNDVGFADLAPEALAAILRDCAAGWCALPTHRAGANFWRDRQRGAWIDRFPPLTAYLGDDGKVYLS